MPTLEVGMLLGLEIHCPCTLMGLDTKHWISLFCEGHKPLQGEGDVCLATFTFSDGEAKVHGAKKVSDFGRSVGERVSMEDRIVCFDRRWSSPTSHFCR
jgi:hypothetical protein